MDTIQVKDGNYEYVIFVGKIAFCRKGPIGRDCTGLTIALACGNLYIYDKVEVERVWKILQDL